MPLVWISRAMEAKDAETRVAAARSGPLPSPGRDIGAKARLASRPLDQGERPGPGQIPAALNGGMPRKGVPSVEKGQSACAGGHRLYPPCPLTAPGERRRRGRCLGGRELSAYGPSVRIDPRDFDEIDGPGSNATASAKPDLAVAQGLPAGVGVRAIIASPRLRLRGRGATGEGQGEQLAW